MLEPNPLQVASSELKSGLIRVGIVLEEDSLTQIDLTVADSPIIIATEDSSSPVTVQPKERLLLIAKENKVLLQNSSGSQISEGKLLRIATETPTFPHATCAVHPIIAGRSFHWKKEISADFSGEFEVSTKGKSLQIVNILPFEEYLACVVVSEMSSGTPREFVKAQTVAARSWARCFLNEKHPGESYELCNDDDCQRYHGVTFASRDSLEASLECAGEFLINEQGHVTPGYYSKCCGGISESAKDCLGVEVPEIIAVTDGLTSASADDISSWVLPNEERDKALFCGGNKETLLKSLGGVDDIGEYFRWEHRELKKDLANYLNDKTDISDAKTVTRLEPKRRGASGRIHELTIHFQTMKGEHRRFESTTQYEIRSLLHPSFLYSTAITIKDEGDSFLFHGAGWGHAVGLCQIGGMFQAISGRSYREILELYFPATTCKKIY